jgi:hypothetical protein
MDTLCRVESDTPATWNCRELGIIESPSFGGYVGSSGF